MIRTLIAAPPGSSDAVREVLEDLSAVGLLRDFHWLEHDGIATGASRVLRVHEGVSHRMQLADVLAGATRITKVLVCVLVTSAPGDRPRSTDDDLSVTAYLNERRGQDTEFDYLRVVVPRGGGAPLPTGSAPAFAGWHNVVIAPEDAHGPRLGNTTVDTGDPLEIARNVAPVLAALCGLWTDVEHRPLDENPALPGETVRVARSFYRRLDGSAVAHGLRTKLFDLRDRLPLPYDRMNPVIYVSEVGQETQRMAEQLWKKDRSMLVGAREAPPTQKGPRLTDWRVILRMFFAFLWAALRAAPDAWQQRYLDERAARKARLIERAILGKGSAYAVVVDGVTADGRRVRPTAFGPAARQLAAAIDEELESGPRNVARSDLSGLWKDYASAAFTLCDALERNAALPPAVIGVDRGVVKSGSDVVPPPRAAFEVRPRSLADKVGTHRVPPSDVAEIDALAERLDELASDSLHGDDATAALAELRRWEAGLKRTLGYAFGRRIVTQLQRTADEVRDLMARILAAAHTQGTRGAGARRWLTVVTWSLVVVFTATITVDVVLVVDGRISPRVGIWVGVSAVVTVTVLAVTVFVLAERALFRLINRRRWIASTVDIDRHNLSVALRDLECLTQAYHQYRSWSRVLGTFLDDPLGFGGTTERGAPEIRWGLPRKAAVGVALPDEDRVERTVAELRTELFRPGWLSDPWRRIVGSVGEQLGPAAHEFRERPQLILAQQGAGSGSALDTWAAMIADSGVPPLGLSALWDQTMTLLGDPREESRRNRLIRGVRHYDRGVPQQLSIAEFRADIGAREPADIGRFDSSLFTDSAYAGGRTLVVPGAAVALTDRELGWIAVTTQFTDGIPLEDLKFGVPPSHADLIEH